MMASKERKTAPELVAMMMDEFRIHQFNDIVDLMVSAAQTGPSNWTASYNIEAARLGPWPVYPEVDNIIRLFQNEFRVSRGGRLYRLGAFAT
jgi:hypothetical protein